jgi:hypothetical protein
LATAKRLTMARTGAVHPVRAYFMSVADLEAIYDAAVAALDAGDYQAAKIGFMKLMARRAAMPDADRSLGTAGRQSIKWRDVDLASLIAQCDKMLAAAAHAVSGPFTMIPVTYARPASSGSYE